MKPTIFSAEVVDTGVSYAFSPTAVLVRFKPGASRNSTYITVPAFPMNPYSYTVPLLGEHVMIYKAIGLSASTTNPGGGICYYGDVIPAKLNLFENAIIGTTSTSYNNNSKKSGQYQNNAGTPNQNKLTTPTLGKTFTDLENTPKYTQPIEGDYLIQGRYGQSIRLGSSYSEKDKKPGQYYDKRPLYKGSANQPILILRTPSLNIGPEAQQYSIENPTEDAASIYLTSTQTMNGFIPAHGLGKGIATPSKFKQPQVLITSDRIIFNAKNERAFIIGKIDVAIVTKDWAMMMNEFFEIVRELLKIFGDQGSVGSPYALVTSQGATLGSVGLKSAMTLLMQRMDAMKQ